MLNHGSIASAVLAVAGPADCWVPKVRVALEVVESLIGEGISVEPITVATRLPDDGFTLADLTGLVIDAGSDSATLDCARLIARHARERRALAEAAELRQAVERGCVDECLPAVLQHLDAIHSARADECETVGKVDWVEFWAQDHSAADWLVEPFLVRGRSHALYAPGKAGKSLFTLAAAVALATGRQTLRQPAGEPVSVTYLDFEMVEDDLQERLTSMGFDETADLSRFNYYLLPSIPPLDTAEGGRALERIISADQPSLVVIDTTARAVAGEENSADTIRDYYRHSGIVLKRAGVTSLRVDHSGKDVTKGQRGTSAKNDDVDIVWQLTRADHGITLRATHRRLGWVPETIDYRQVDEPTLHYVPAAALWPQGTAEVADLLDKFDVALDASERTASAALRQAGHGRRQTAIRAALKWRRARLEESQWAS